MWLPAAWVAYMYWFETSQSASKFEIPLTPKYYPGVWSRKAALSPVSLLVDLKDLFFFSNVNAKVFVSTCEGQQAFAG